MEKERFGAFVSEKRKSLGMTQKDLAERLNVTDKAVSKWERGLSYPDVTLLEPLADHLELSVAELIACQEETAESKVSLKTEAQKEEIMQSILDISEESVRRERGRGRRWIMILSVLLLGVILATILFISRNQQVKEDGRIVILYKEYLDNTRYIYLEREGHLLRLECAPEVDYDGIDPKSSDEWTASFHWNRRTYQGRLLSLRTRQGLRLGTPMDEVGASDSLYAWDGDALFGFPNVMMKIEDRYPNPAGSGYLSSYSFFKGGDEADWYRHADELLVKVDHCLGYGSYGDGGWQTADVDDDGRRELLVRTPWTEKPCILYDLEDGEVTETWLDEIPPELNAPAE